MKKNTWLLLLILLITVLVVTACGQDNEKKSWDTYENPYYTLQYPDDYTVQEEDMEIMISTLFMDEEEEKMIGITMNSLTDDFTEEELYAIWDEDLVEMEDTQDDFYFKERDVQGNKAYEVHFNFSREERIFRVLTIHEGFIFSMDARVPQEAFDDFLPTPQQMIESLEFQK